jgi:hypothetical protein
VLDSVGERLEGTHGNRLLGGVLTRRVRFGKMRNNDLGVGLGSERSRFEQRLLVEDTSSVHVLTCVKGKGRNVSYDMKLKAGLERQVWKERKDKTYEQ